jgi:hypothetical protein
MQSVLASYGSDDETAETESTSKPKDDEARAKLRAQAEKFDSLLNQAKKAVPRQVRSCRDSGGFDHNECSLLAQKC